jgi:hypothetical protein
MKVYQEKIAPPPAPPTDKEQMKVRAEAIADEDRWVNKFVERLTGIIRDVKH